MKNKIIISFSITIFLIVLLGVTAIFKMQELAKLSENLYAHPYTVTTATKTIQSNLISMNKYMKDITTAKSDMQIEDTVFKLNQSEAIIYKQYEIVFDRYLGDRDDIQKSFDSFIAWKPARDDVIEKMLQKKKENFINIEQDTNTNYVVHLNEQVDKLVDYAHNKAIYFNENAMNKKNTATILIIIILVLVLFVVIILLIALVRNLTELEKDEELAYIKKEQHRFIGILREEYTKIDDLKEICDRSINHLIGRFNAINGSLYIFDEDNEKLYLAATYGLKYSSLKQTLELHENLISENILEKKIKVIDINKEVNLGNITIQCTKLVTLPIMEFEKSIGTVQLVFDDNFDAVDLEFLETVISLMGTYIYKAEKDDESKRYLKLIDQNVLFSKTDLHGSIISVSEQLCNLSKYTKEELIGKTHRVLRHPDMPKETFKDIWQTITKGNIWRGEIKNKTKDGGYYWISSVIAPDLDLNGNIIGYSAIRNNITDKKTIEEIAITDGLTSLYNRRHFDSLFPHEINMSKRDNNMLAFVLIDIDHFKQYNDTYGHQEGDTTLKLVAGALSKILQRPNDYAFRLGGEEFGLLYHVENRDDALEIANKAITSIESLKIIHSGNSASKYVTISSGLYLIENDDDSSVENIYKKADEALYSAKQNGKNQVSKV